MAPYYLSLNKAVLLFFPSASLDATSDASAQSHVVQVIINTSGTPTVGLLTSFFLAQADIAVRDCGLTSSKTNLKWLIV